MYPLLKKDLNALDFYKSTYPAGGSKPTYLTSDLPYDAFLFPRQPQRPLSSLN